MINSMAIINIIISLSLLVVEVKDPTEASLSYVSKYRAECPTGDKLTKVLDMARNIFNSNKATFCFAGGVSIAVLLKLLS